MSPKAITEDMQEMVALYALGALTQHEARALENRLSEDHGLAEELAAFEAVTAGLALTVPESCPSPSLRQTLLARIATESRAEAKQDFQMPVVPQEFSSMFSLRTGEVDWFEIGPGILTKTLFVDETLGTVTSLVRMMPGSALPPHRHRGDEQFYILEGDCNVHGARLGPGDFHHAPPHSIHESTFTVEGTTFLLIAPADYEILQSAERTAR